MKIVKSSVEVLTPINGERILNHIETIARTCYQSQQSNNNHNLVKSLIRSEHFAMLEHYNISVKFVTDRGVSHEIVRHRLASFAQESTRYCNYSKDKFGNEISVIKPTELKEGSFEYIVWQKQCEAAERTYFKLLDSGVTPETARSVLPTSLKTTIVMTANVREWRHFLNLRAVGTTGKPHPDIKVLADDLLEQFKEQVPILFDDIKYRTPVVFDGIKAGESI